MKECSNLLGYNENFCVKCTFGNREFSKGDINVSQSPLVNCAGSLSVNTGNSVFSDPYDASTSSGVMFAVPDDFFGNTGGSSCSWTSCTLKSSDCLGSYTGSYISVNSNNNVYSVRNVNAGYTENFCLFCKNDFEFIEKPGISF